MSTIAPRWRRLEYDERRAQILDAARALFSERRFSAVSTAEIATAAGVTRGLLNHYFGTKRDLYLEVVREMVGPSAIPISPPASGRPMADVVVESVDLWLDMVESHREMWFAFIGAEGFGRDEEIERIVGEYRDATVELIIELLGLDEELRHREEMRAVLRTYSGLAQVASVEWLQRRSLTHAQVRALLCGALHALVADAPRIIETAGQTGS